MSWYNCNTNFAIISCIILAQISTLTSGMTLPKYYAQQIARFESEMYPDTYEYTTNYEPDVTEELILRSQIYTEPLVDTRKDQPKIHTNRRSKRAPSGLYNLVFGARTHRSPQPSPTPRALEFTSTDPQRIHDLIVKMRMWEAALLIQFRDRFGQNPEALAMDPMWAKLIQVRSAINVLLSQYEQYAQSQDRELDVNRMK